MGKTGDVLIYELIDRWLSKPGRSQAAMARALKVSDATVSRWRTGESTPEEFRADELAELLGMTPSKVLNAIARQKYLQEEARRPPSREEMDRLVDLMERATTELEALKEEVAGLKKSRHGGGNT